MTLLNDINKGDNILAAKIRDFVEVWEDLSAKGKERALRFLMKAYGNDLLTYMKFISSCPDIEKQEETKKMEDNKGDES